MVTTEDTIEQFRALMADPAAHQAFVEIKAEHAQADAGRRYEHVLRVVGSRPWAIEESVLAIIVDVLAFRAYGGRWTAEEIEGRIGAARRTPNAEAPQGVARIPISGVLVPRASAFNRMSGGTSAEEISGMVAQAVASSDVGSIVLDIDSPGGMVDGIPELASQIRAARLSKPVVAVANTEAMSAAYWLASQADRIFASPSARVGSIGVLSTHEDRSLQAEQKGVKTTIISAGKYKAEGNPFEPLTDEGTAHMQSLVDEFYGMFVRDVAKGRSVTVQDVRDGYGEGRFFGAKKAESLGMVDGIATVDEVIASEFTDMRNRAAALGPSAKVYTLGAADSTTSNGSTLTAGSSALGADSDDDLAAIDRSVAESTEQWGEDHPIEAAVDNSTWDGNRAMSECNSAADYRQICAAEHSVGTPDERQHWALPHHYLGRGPNAGGVTAARQRISQTQNISDAERAKGQRHLDAHQSEITPNASASRYDNEIEAIEAELGVLSSD